MTEESYQAGKKLMQKATGFRSSIIKAKANVSKWTNLESWYIQEKKESHAAAANLKLHKAMDRLNKLRQQFADLKFPDSNIQPQAQEKISCERCGMPMPAGNGCYCIECIN